MTTINTVDDLARILREHPAWTDTLRALLLTEDLLNLPARLDQFIQSQEAMNERLDETIQRLDEANRRQEERNQRLDEANRRQEERNQRLDETIQRLEEASHRQEATIQRLDEANRRQEETNQRLEEAIQSRHEETIQRLDEANRRQEETNQRLEEANRSQEETNQRLDESNQRLEETIQSRHEETIQRLDESNRRQEEINRNIYETLDQMKADISETSQRVTSLEGRFNRMEGRFSNFEGGQYERTVRAKALARSQFNLGLGTVYYALSQDGIADSRLLSAIGLALNQGRVTRDESGAIYETDLIISDEENRHAVFEISLTADTHDIQRAKQRAGILEAITGGTVTPAVITARIDDARYAEAQAEEVAVFVIPYP